MKRRSFWMVAAALIAMFGITLAAVPEARAQVAKLFGWNSYEVTEQPGATITFDRKPDAAEPVPKDLTTEQKTVRRVAEARALLPQGAALPPALEGQELLISRVLDKSGTIVSADLAEPNTGFWTRYREGGQHDRVHATYGADFTVTTEERTIAGRAFEIVTATQSGGKALVTIWGQDGPWMYEVHGYGRDMDRLVKLLETMN